MRKFDDNSIDAVVTDPPYGISFMSKAWDYDVPTVELWRECLRVMKPGSHALVACGTRTQHRMACNLEDAGFEIRDVVAWLYGSGFPKSHDVSKAIDKAAGAERALTRAGTVKRDGYGDDWDTGSSNTRPRYDEPATPAARQWQGWGTALKPAMELFTLVRKPLSEHTVAANVLRWGTGALNIDACRVGNEVITTCGGDKFPNLYGKFNTATETQHVGRWPANVTHDGSQQVLNLMPVTKARGNIGGSKGGGGMYGHSECVNNFGASDSGSAARFFYCAKASKSERNHGLAEFAEQTTDASNFRPNHTEKAADGHAGTPYGRFTPTKNNHPTVKPVKLMLWLCNLITPPGGTVLDPFMGSGTTGIACAQAGFEFIGIERELPYLQIAEARIAAA